MPLWQGHSPKRRGAHGPTTIIKPWLYMDAVKKQLVLALLLPAWQQEIPQAWQKAGGKEKELFWFGQEEGKCFLSWLPRGGSILAEATCPPGQRVLLRFLSKAVQANSGPFISSIQMNILYLVFILGFFPLFSSQWDETDVLSAPSSLPGCSMECLSACSTVTKFLRCISRRTDQLPLGILMLLSSNSTDTVVSETTSNSTHRYFA